MYLSDNGELLIIRTDMKKLLKTLEIQRWDDHRYYHHSRINQSLHLLSALSFLVSYIFLFINPIYSSLIAWLVAMTSRQAGHFFFEPKSYDTVNLATHDHKEEIKVGYNLNRKIVLLSIWAVIPLIYIVSPEFVHIFVPKDYEYSFISTVGIAWLFLGFFGLFFRAGQLLIKENLYTSVAWVLKIITDPFHDVKLYYKSPWFLFVRRQLIDPMAEVTKSLREKESI
tara:strand:- start:1356 stop:2033 length:678 start_codon:yes stop_codon:yes gene_type:complete